VHRKSLFALASSLILWSSAFVAIKAGSEAYSPGAMALLRFLIASFALLIYYCFSSNTRGKIAKRDMLLCFLVGAALAGYQIGLNIGEKDVPSSLASFIVSTQPIMVILIAAFFLKEKFTLYSLIGLSVSTAGIIIIFYSNHETKGYFNMPVLMILLATFSNSLYFILQKPLLDKYRATQILPWYIWFTTLVLLPYLPQLIHDTQNASFNMSMVIIYLGVFPTLVAFALWTYAISIIPISKAASAFYLTPFLTMAIGYLLLSDRVSTYALLGGIVTIVGAFIINLPVSKSVNIK
jgi:drug/metabolite transporter (DMT)-like permease